MNRPRLVIALVVFYLVGAQFVPLRGQPIEPWQVVSIELSKDGRYLAVRHESSIWRENGVYAESGIWIYDLWNLLSPPLFLSEADRSYTRMLFSPDGTYLAVGNFYRLSVFEVNGWDVILDLTHSATPTRSDFRRIAFSPDSKYLMSFSYASNEENEVSIWDIEAGQRVHTIPVEPNQAHIGQLWLSPDWRQFIKWSYGKSEIDTVHDFDITRGVGAARGEITSGFDREVGAVFSADSALFALATLDGKLQVYETTSWTLVSERQFHDTPCGEGGVSLAIAHKHPWLAAECAWESLLTVWDFERDEMIFRDERYSFGGGVQFSSNDAYLLANRNINLPVGYNLAVWDIEDDFELTLYPGTSPRVHPNSELMVAIAHDSRIWIWNLKQNKLLVILPAQHR